MVFVGATGGRWSEDIHRTSAKAKAGQMPSFLKKTHRTVFLVPMGLIVGVRLCQTIRRVVVEFVNLWSNGCFSAQFQRGGSRRPL